MIRPPSNATTYTAVWSKDPAFVQLDDKASDEDKKEHAAKWKRARETGDYGPLLVEGGGQPTQFQMRPLKADHFAALADMSTEGNSASMVLLAFRVALNGLVNFPEQLTTVNHPRFGKIASIECFDKAGVPAGVTNQIARELGTLAFEKAQELNFT